MDGPIPYEEDFHAWTRAQAEALRRLRRTRRDLPNDLDLEHVAEEIEDTGRTQRKLVASHLRQMLVHAIKLAASPGSDAVPGWKTEIIDHQEAAVDHFEPSMRQHIDLADLWRRAVREADRKLAVYDEALPDLPTDCPLTLDDLLDEDFAVEDLVRRLGGASQTG